MNFQIIKLSLTCLALIPGAIFSQLPKKLPSIPLRIEPKPIPQKSKEHKPSFTKVLNTLEKPVQLELTKFLSNNKSSARMETSKPSIVELRPDVPVTIQSCKVLKVPTPTTADLKYFFIVTKLTALDNNGKQIASIDLVDADVEFYADKIFKLMITAEGPRFQCEPLHKKKDVVMDESRIINHAPDTVSRARVHINIDEDEMESL